MKPHTHAGAEHLCLLSGALVIAIGGHGYTHGGSLAINRELAGYDELSTYQMLRSSTTLFVLLMDAMYSCITARRTTFCGTLRRTYFAEKR